MPREIYTENQCFKNAKITKKESTLHKNVTQEK